MGRIFPLPRLLESSGAAAGHAQDASAGLTIVLVGGDRWAWNPLQAQWQRTHTIVSGNTLWNLSGSYYGAPSLAGVQAIYAVPQNRAIQGPSPDSGLIPGDVILIPNVTRPAALPLSGPSPNVQVDQPVVSPVGGGTGPLPGPVVGPDVHVTGGPQPVQPPAPVPGPNGQIVKPEEPKKFWTTGKIVAAGVIGASAIGIAIAIAIAASRKKKRRRAA